MMLGAPMAAMAEDAGMASERNFEFLTKSASAPADTL